MDQRLSLIDTLKAYTIGGAYAEFKEHKKGMIKENYLADIVILSDRIDHLDINEISKIKVMCTIVDGKLVYKADR